MKSLSISIAMILAGAVSGIAGTSVWSYDKKTGNEMQPGTWYRYANPEDGGAVGKLEDTEEGYKQFTAKVVIGASNFSSAGFGFAWKKSGVVDLSGYTGLCLTYKAERPFRLDFKQTSITDYDYYGVDLDAQADFVSKFIDFQSIAREGWGKNVALDLTDQEAIQISYKENVASSFADSDKDRVNNVITLSAVSLGECDASSSVGLKVLSPYDKAQTVSLKETDTLKIPLVNVFSVPDETKLELTSRNVKILPVVSPEGDLTLKDTLVLVAGNVNKDTTLNFYIRANYGSESERVDFNVTIKDEGEGPVGPTCPGDPECPDQPSENHSPKVLAPYDVAVEHNMKESDTLKVPLAKLFTDEDNDKLSFAIEYSVPLMKNLTSLSKVTLNDTLFIIPISIKADTSLVVAIHATDGKADSEDAIVHFNVKIEDENLGRAPIATTVEYDAKEDTPLSVPLATGIRALGGSDPDGDDVLVILTDSTKYGALTGFTQYGSFIYTPQKNFHGDDTLRFVLVETANHKMMSDVAMAIIHVAPVNDAPTYTIADSTFLKPIELDMNFAEDTVKQIKIPTKSLVFSDLEVTEGTQKLTYRATGKNIIPAVDSVNATYYFISVKPVVDASGDASIFFYAFDGADSAGVTLPVKLVSPKDVAHAENDKYTTYNDSVLTVSAKDGVLANDVYPEGVTKGMEAELAQAPAYGTLVLNKDGSFKYTPKAGYDGVDIFGYYDVINGTKSKAAIVTISIEKRNQLPNVVVKTETLDTTVTEDFPTTRALKYTKAMVTSWFKDPEGDTLSYSAKSKDGKLKVEITTAGTLEINSVPDSTGKAYVVVTATDKKSGSKSFEFCVTITPVNDKPVVRHPDTVYVAKSNWKVKWDLDTLVTDVDGDELTYTPNETRALTKYMSISMKGSVLTVTAIEGLSYKDGQKFAIGVKAADQGGLNVTVPLYIIIGENTGLKPTLAQPKATWQNAVMAKRGSVSITDMKGRKVWSAKLPVNPAEVMNASAEVQGRKILRVNNQTWTIK